MSSVCIRVGALLVCLLALWGCSSDSKPPFIAKHEPWRATEERQCLSAGVVRETRFVQGRSALGGPSVCGALRPFKMSAANSGRVRLQPAALLRCPMVPQVDRWVARSVLPAARRFFGQPVVEIKVAASYSCRPINGTRGRKLSEHGHANAIDISRFTLADGRVISLKKGWWGRSAERGFLRTIHKAACREFTTVLGPNYNRLHHDHFHFDLARHGKRGTHRVCK